MRPEQFVQHLDHKTFKYISGQHKLNSRHVKRVEFLLYFSFVLKYKPSKTNVVADAPSRRYSTIVVLDTKVLCFNSMKELCNEDREFSPIINNCKHGVHGPYSIQNGFHFKGSKICVPKISLRELLVREAYHGGLVGNLGINKALEFLQEHLDWPEKNGVYMQSFLDVQRVRG